VKQEAYNPQFVEFLTEELQDGTLYVSMRFATVSHLCANFFDSLRIRVIPVWPRTTPIAAPVSDCEMCLEMWSRRSDLNGWPADDEWAVDAAVPKGEKRREPHGARPAIGFVC
jgi:hypothetical protein